jgi:hypothetical protein
VCSARESLKEDILMQPLARMTLVPITLAVSLLLITSAAAAAQVATLRTPDPDALAPQAQVEEGPEGQEAILAFAACMRDNGIDFPDPQFGVGGGFFGGGRGDGDGPPFDFQSAEFQGAFQTCGTFLQALQPDLDPEQQAEQGEQQLAFAQCMRDEGIDFPDPDPDGGFGFGRGGGADAPFDFQSDEFQTAFGICQTNVGFGFGPGGGGPGNGPGGGNAN